MKRPATGKSKKGLTLVYDVARRFAQPLGIHLDRWENRIIVIEKGIVRLLPVIDRAEQLLGEDGAIGAADLIERTKGKNINYEFAFARELDERPSKPKAKTRKGGAGAARDEAPAPKQGTHDAGSSSYRDAAAEVRQVECTAHDGEIRNRARP